MSTYRELLRSSEDVPDRERLLRGLMNWPLSRFICMLDEEAEPEAAAYFLQGISRLRAHEPLQYILGEAPFFGRMFQVDPRVLIPRFDTEILVEEALREIDRRISEEDEDLRVLDLCTGSGCIAVTIRKERPMLRIEASDLSSDALELARLNEQSVTSETGGIRWIQSDLFEKIPDAYDLIVTNPPYISDPVIDGLEPEVRDHEPRLALSGGADGLDILKRIAEEAGGHLRDRGVLLMEIGDEEGPETQRILKENGFKDLRIIRDLSGRDRVVKARKEEND